MPQTNPHPAYRIPPEVKGKIIGVLLLLPTLPHLVFAQCHLRNTWPIAEELFAGGFLIAAILLARAISKHPRALPPLPMWKAALPFASLSLLAGALAAVDGIAFARAAVFFTAKEHTRTTATVETSRPMRGCRTSIEFFDSTIEASVTACASEYGFTPRAGDRIIVEKLVSPIGIQLQAIAPLRNESAGLQVMPVT
ncbi:hypothetical protein ACEQ38_16520 [Ralstonia syzygii subsp. celebesensis]|uniref:Transmembrane protein n=2 Tax=Ralstonia solanacearum species complex TaxID=3116862 RepID=A0AAD0SAR5_RALSL|nr:MULTISPECIES: hypothetical protein [Ralstonia solanacearum species complex]AQW30329.1 hypothetical protein B0B51_10305 [blood disease bacterium A2-HR MARDI]AXV83019.1 hypothetical protein CJO77_16580 [Ralstonia solanacearum]AXW54134.1 hypothetical protein CJO92_16585 [Ralstonia solanacearum]QQV55838.1 hypothetical protein JK151_01880 [Ralstonia syzygii subsp. celebesensis]